MNTQKRRTFLKTSVAGTVAMGLLTHQRAYGANERVNIGIIGCGGRGSYHIGWLHRTTNEQPLDVIAACDIWSRQRDRAQQEISNRFEKAPTLYSDYRKLLENPDIDAVVIATCDHQHCGMLCDAVDAGKDVYVEKPIAMELDELNQTYDKVKASKQIVQHGTQGRSSRGAPSTREIIQSGKLGKLLRVEESRSHYQPYWNHYPEPEKEADTNWQAFLYNRPYRPFNIDQHAHWMGYRDFSSGTIGGWMSHLCDFIHYLTDCGFPVSATAQGGIYAPTSDPRRTCPDTITALLHYQEGFTVSFTTHFGNGANNYDQFYFTQGTLTTKEPDGGIDGIHPIISGEGSEHENRITKTTELDNTIDEDHMTNWIRCIRERKQPNANMEQGYKHGVACILADRAFVEKRMMMFDPVSRQIYPA